MRAFQDDRTLQHQMVACGQRGFPARFDHRRCVLFGDDRGTGDNVTGTQRFAQVDRRLAPGAVGENTATLRRAQTFGARREFRGRLVGDSHDADRLDRNGLDHECLVAHQETILRTVATLELGSQCGDRRSIRMRVRRQGIRDFERRIGPVVFEVHRALQLDHGGIDALRLDFTARRVGQARKQRSGRRERRPIEHGLDRVLTQRTHIGQPHAVCGEHARKRMNKYARHSERVGHRTCMLPARTAKTAQRVFGDVVAALDRNVLDRVRHVVDGDLEKTFRDLFRCALPPCGGGHRLCQGIEAHPDDGGVERHVAVRTEYGREQRRIDLADHDVAVGDRQRAAATVGGGTRIRAGRFGPDPEACAIEAADRSAAGRHGVNAHHRRPQPHPGDFGDECALVFARVVGDVGRRATHVEADDLVEAREARHLHRTDDATGRARQDRVLALEAMCLGQPARGLHELQADPGQLGLHLRDVAPQDRRQVRVDDRRVATRHEFHQRTDFVTDRHLSKTDGARKRRQLALVLGEAVTMHEHDRARADPIRVGCAELPRRRVDVEWNNDIPVGSDAFVDLDHAFVHQARQHDVADEQLRAVLIGDAQRVAKAAGDEEHGPLATTFEQRIGRHRRAHLDGLDRGARYRRVRAKPEQFTNAMHRRVAVTLRVFGQQLVGHQLPVWPAGDDVGEGTAAVDPELPAGTGGKGHDGERCAGALYRSCPPSLGVARCGTNATVKDCRAATPRRPFPRPKPQEISMKSLRVLVAALGLSLASGAFAQTKWDLPTAYPPTNFHTENITQFVADVDKATGGKLKITVHPNASLFKAPEIKRAVQGQPGAGGRNPSGELRERRCLLRPRRRPLSGDRLR